MRAREGANPAAGVKMPAMYAAAPPSTLPSPARAGSFAPLHGEALGDAAHRVLEHVFG